MINIGKISSEIATDVAISGQACRELFWDIAELAEHVRSHIRQRRILRKLSERERDLYRQLGRDAYTLFAAGVSIERTPQIDATLGKIHRSKTLRRQYTEDVPLSPGDVRTAISARRLARIIGTGSWRIHPVPITQESPWRGGTLTGDMPTGICLAVRRDQSLQPFTPDWRFLDGDVLLVLAPPTCYSDWDQWIANGARDARDARPN